MTNGQLLQDILNWCQAESSGIILLIMITTSESLSKMTAPAPTPQGFWSSEANRGFVLSGLTLVGVVAGYVSKAYGASTLELAFFALAFLAGGVPASGRALASLWQRKLDVDLLMVVAAIGAASVGQAGDGAILLFLFSLSNTLQSWAMGRTRRAIEALMSLHPQGANVVQSDGSLLWKPLADLDVGDVLLVRPGERFAADAVIIDGFTEVDESALTGESVPIDKATGDSVRSGTLNGHGAVRVKVQRAAGQSTLAKLIELVEGARAAKSRTERFAERFEGPYALVVLLSAPVVFAVAHYGFGLDAAQAWYRAMTFLVVASPCAVVIATPAAVLSAMAAGARAGALFKSVAALESLATVKTVAFDKTGTLTQGRMQLVEVVPLTISENDAKALAASLEHYSEHPFAKAIVGAYQGEFLPTQNPSTLRGQGIKATLGPDLLWIGNRRMAQGQNTPLGPAIEKELQALEAKGFTTAILGRNQEVLALLAVADTPRPEARQALAALKQRGLRLVMLTGDRHAVAQHIANQLGLDEVRAELLPEQKLEVVRQLSQQSPVAMIGDGINDAPALSAAQVGVSMAAGSDVSLESADLVLMRNDLLRLVGAYDLAKATLRTVRFNLSFALGVIAIVGGLALAGQVPLPLGVVAHEGGTVFVVLVGLRLLAHRLRV